LYAPQAHGGGPTMPLSAELVEKSVGLFSHPWHKAAIAATGSGSIHAAIGVQE